MAISETLSHQYIGSISHQYTERWIETAKGDNKQYVPEKYQLGVVTDFLKQKGISFSTEHRIYCYPIDIVGVQRNTTIAIELKSKDFKRGIEQARRNAAFVDYSFLSVWSSNITPNLHSRVEGLDIGLIGVNSGVKFLSAPSKTPKQLYAKDRIIESVEAHVRNDATVQESE